MNRKPRPSPTMDQKTWDEAIFENQTEILRWLQSKGHEIDDPHLQPDKPEDGLNRTLRHAVNR